MAHKKGTGSTRNGRDSNAQRLGVKLFGGQLARPGSILVRQRGTKFHPGINVRRGRDDTLYSVRYGIVQFERFGKKRKRINVQPFPEVADKQMSYQDAYRTYRASVDVASHRVSADDASDVASTAEEDMEDDMQKQLVQKVAAQFKQSAARKTDIGKLHSHSNSTNQNIRLEERFRDTVRRRSDSDSSMVK